MNKKQTIDQSVQPFTVNTGIESSCWMMNVISQKVGPSLMELTFFTQISKIQLLLILNLKKQPNLNKNSQSILLFSHVGFLSHLFSQVVTRLINLYTDITVWPLYCFHSSKNTILMEITSFGRTWQAAIMPNTQQTFYARIWSIMSFRQTIPLIYQKLGQQKIFGLQ